MKAIDFTGIAYLAALALAGVIVWQLYSKGQGIVTAGAAAVKEAASALNPLADTNLAYKAASAITPGTDNTFGGWLYDVLNPGTTKLVAQMSGPVSAPSPDFLPPLPF
jgi:hypothetical protein